MEYTTLINVNTLSDEYYNEVLNYHSEELSNSVLIRRTESNGYAGKGHNSCLEIFKELIEYDYMIMLDGDDLFYPVAFSQIEKCISISNPDVIHLMLNDNVTTHKKNNQHYNLLGNYRVYTSLDKQENWWHSIDVDNVFTTPIQSAKTPSRLILANRKIFNTTHKIRYSEKCHLYDDLLAFLSFVEGNYRDEINVVAISDPNIYCYNGSNDESVTSLFTENDYSLEQSAFNEECAFLNALKNDWNYLKKLPFTYIETPKNFTLETRMEICKEFAKFELLDRIKHAETAQNNENYKVASTQYNRVVSAGVSNEVINLNRGICLMKSGNKEKAVVCFEEMLYKPVENYKYDIHFYLGILHVHLGNIQRAKVHALECLNINKTPQMEKIIALPSRGLELIPTPKKSPSGKKVICFYSGYSNSFNGKNYQQREVYGSENAVVHVAEELAKQQENQVFVFGAFVPEDEITWNNVVYMNVNNFHSFHSQVHINVMVVSRYIHFFYVFKLHADKVFLWVHDAQFHDHFNGSQFNKNGQPFGYNLIKSGIIDEIICVSDWQREYLKQWSKIPEDHHYKLKVIGNSIDKSMFDHSLPKIKNRFIYCSDTVRGLDVLLDQWSDILLRIPDATLSIYFGRITKEQENKIKQFKSTVKFHGKIPQKDLCLELCKSDFWYYPNTMHETFCIVGMQALYAKCVCVCRDYSGVSQVISTYGLRIEGFPKETQFKEKALTFLSSVANDINYKKRIQENAVNGATSWEEITPQWNKLINY